MPMKLPPLTLVIGAAASGKSRFAEGLLDGAKRKIYLATAQAHDAEMRAKIDLHAARRGAEWHTVNAPLDLDPALGTADAPVLLDCATMWLTNHLLADHDLTVQEAALLDALAACPAPVIVVSNEVGAGIVPENALARAFREAQGRLNQRLAVQADQVALVAAGLPLWLKGEP